MNVNLNEILNTVQNKLESTNIILTGLEEEEKEITTILHGLGLINHGDTNKDIVVFGSSTGGNKKIQQALKAKTPCYSLEEFKKEFLFNHKFKNFFHNKTILIDSNFDYKTIMPVYLLNPKNVLWTNQINKRKVQEVDIVVSNEQNLENVKDGLKSWLQDREYEQFILNGNILDHQHFKIFKKQFSH